MKLPELSIFYILLNLFFIRGCIAAGFRSLQSSCPAEFAILAIICTHFVQKNRDGNWKVINDIKNNEIVSRFSSILCIVISRIHIASISQSVHLIFYFLLTNCKITLMRLLMYFVFSIIFLVSSKNYEVQI